MKDITIVIKTFNRKESLIKMLTSIQKLASDYPVAIADDSEYSYRDEILAKFPRLSISYFRLPFDSGLSKGRNFLLNNINTELLLLCDDDFVFDSRTDLKKAKQIMLKNNVDILSGVVYNFFKVKSKLDKLLMQAQHLFSRGFAQTYVGLISENEKEVIIDIKTRIREEFTRCDTVHNFFIGKKTPILNLGGWDERLKLSEHEEFFLRAKHNNLKVGHSGNWGVRHYPLITSDYVPFRGRNYELIVFNAHNIDKITQIVDNGSTFIKIRENNEIKIQRVFHNTVRGTAKKIYYKIRSFG